MSEKTVAEEVLLDTLQDKREDNLRIFYFTCFLLLANVLLGIGLIGQYVYFTEKMAKQQTEFIKFLEQYDIMTISQDSEGINIYNKGNQGDVTNGAKN